MTMRPAAASRWIRLRMTSVVPTSRPGARLVEDDDRRIVEERRRQQDLLPHALRVRAHRRVAIESEAEDREQRVDAAPRDRARAVRAAARRTSGTRRRSSRCRAAPPPARSRGAACSGACPIGRSTPSSSTEPPDGSSSPVSIPTVVDLPEPFGPSRPSTAPVLDAEVDVPDPGDRRVVLRQSAGFEHDPSGHRNTRECSGRIS